ASQLPGSEYRAVGRWFAGPYRSQDLLICRHINFPPVAIGPNPSGPDIGAIGTSNIEEHGLSIALKINVEGVDDRTVPFRSRRYQRFAPFGLLNNVQDRIVGIRDLLVAKIHARREADID